VSQFRKENRDADAVVGEYSYTDPLGHVRTVKYTADKLHGFRADIYVDGKLETLHSSSHHHDVQPEAHAEANQPVHHVQHQEPAQYDESRDYSGSNEDY
jgi:Insect cuticle protein